MTELRARKEIDERCHHGKAHVAVRPSLEDGPQMDFDAFMPPPQSDDPWAG